MSDSNSLTTAYQAAIEMANHEGDNVWSRFNVMLVANSIILFALTGSFDNASNNRPLFAIGGILLCLLWLPLMKRSFTYETYYIVKARLIEQQMNLGPLNVLIDGELLSKGKTIEVLGSPIRMSRAASIPARIIVDATIGLFILGYTWFLRQDWILLVIVGILYVIVLALFETTNSIEATNNSKK